MIVRVAHRTEMGLKYSPRAFRSQIGEEAPLRLPSGQHVIGVLREAIVHPTGLAAELVYDVPELKAL